MRSLVALALLAAAPAAAEITAPNLVAVSARLVTSGQPRPEALAQLKQAGYGAVIYLAPPTVHDAVREEHAIVAGQGLVFINLPVDFGKPTPADFRAFAALLQALGERKVLVHCQVNLRASSMVFLYRAVVLREDPRLAYEAVSRVWQPTPPWRSLMQAVLAEHRIDFDPF